MILKLTNQKSRTKYQKGYTIIELVIVILVILVVGGIIVGIIYSSIRGTTKARVNNNISQNGNYAITVMSNFIANAKNLVDVTGSDGISYESCVPPVFGEAIQAQSITITNFDNELTTFTCDGATISSNSASLIDAISVEVVPGTCVISCLQESAYRSPRIDLTFELQSKGSSTPESSGKSLFNTSVTMRNYGL